MNINTRFLLINFFGLVTLFSAIYVDVKADEKTGLGLHKDAPYTTYFTSQKSQNTQGLKSAFPTPETRAGYTYGNTELVDANLGHMGSQVDVLESQVDTYNQLLKDATERLEQDVDGHQAGDQAGEVEGDFVQGTQTGSSSSVGGLGVGSASLSSLTQGGALTGSSITGDNLGSIGNQGSGGSGLNALRSLRNKVTNRIKKTNPGHDDLEAKLRKEGKNLFGNQTKKGLAAYKKAHPKYGSTIENALSVGTGDKAGEGAGSEKDISEADKLAAMKNLLSEDATDPSIGANATGKRGGYDFVFESEDDEAAGSGTAGDDDSMSKQEKKDLYNSAKKLAARSKYTSGKGDSAGINKDQDSSLFKVVTKRYKISAFPVFFAPTEDSRIE